ncbi:MULTISPECIES: LysM peptidoglycan-binding domain-containing protein [Acidithiobacillus]|uniref:Lytic transglycosylase n=2 Tax=Acidithiobacillus TaxID=119977 RepID=A0A179BJE2_ACIFR|nr:MULTISPECIES: LysM peptidoglycan-binding domain-containing protein [Acidithiobacillus]MDA8182370.1 LysM peptidoglycan-binding domain-containing protein [Acidithiobacillus sp.]MBU2854697.1 LysM peptidoglycan-binding domain-containing protein [Acidithiobacillus ferriphilus]MEB8486133.1 LysM peptidoglycan-binding domain-containing protein [Acidithiobacillus ferriphilus]MEB8489488.1 LysM peptidoglycan-binding domain-containing protein [Acidithiobacillus ferriphilus]MEB8493141.1 LysM peptidoglyc
MKKRIIAVATLMALGGIPMVWAESQTIGLQQSDLQSGVAEALNSTGQSGNASSLSATLQQFEASGAFGHQTEIGNVWTHIDDGLRISDVSRVEVDKWRTWFLQHQGKLEQIFDNSRPFLYYVVSAIAQRGLPMELALLPAIESGYNPKAYSPAAAAGLWQFIPGTARNFGLQNTRYGDPRLSLTASTNAALDYLSYLYNYFGGNWLLAIASYNAGQGTVSAAIQQNVAAGKPTDFWDLNLPEQTENYVAELLALAQVIKNASAYHVSLPVIPNAAHIAVVTTPKSVALNVAANLMNMPVSELRRLNAGLSYGVAPADYQLVVPKGKAGALKTALLTMPQEVATHSIAAPAAAPRLSHITLRRGETLWHLAQRAGVSITNLKRWNHIRSARDLRVGQRLVVYGASGLRHAIYAQNSQPLRVRPGNTLSQLAQRAGVSVHDLMRWNHIRSARDLQVGEILHIRGGGSAPAPVYTAARSHQRLTVRPGESLWQIAQRAGVGVSVLAHANHLTERTVLHPGQVLNIPAHTVVAAINHRQERAATRGRTTTYVVRQGDTLWQIAQQFHVQPHSLMQWNRLASASDIQPGSRLTIYTR